MRTKFFLWAAAGMIALAGLALLALPNPVESESMLIDIIFEGTVYDGGSPTSSKYTVKCYSPSDELVGTTLNDINGNYEITGYHSNYPTGTYRIVVDENGPDEGSNNGTHIQGTTTTINVWLGEYRDE